MSEKLTPMDRYSAMDIPFDIAAYCRGHKFSVQAVELTRAIGRRDGAKMQLENAERALEEAEADVKKALASVRQRMEDDPHA